MQLRKVATWGPHTFLPSLWVWPIEQHLEAQDACGKKLLYAPTCPLPFATQRPSSRSRRSSTTLAEFPPCAKAPSLASSQQPHGLIIHILPLPLALAVASFIIATTSADAAAATSRLQTNLPFLSRLILTFPSTLHNLIFSPIRWESPVVRSY